MHELNPSTAIPPFLQGIVSVMREFDRAGEWDLIIPRLGQATDYGFPLPWAVTLLEDLLAAFPWVRIHTLHLGSGQVTPWRWTTASGELQPWLTTLRQQAQQCSGLEASLDLELAWVAPDGSGGQVWLPEAGALIGGMASHQSGFLVATLTIWPNLFTDEIDIYSETQPGQMCSSRIAFTPAAAMNRARLAASLRAWEQRSGGEIKSWMSEIVEGIERYGFADDARPW